MSNEKLKVEPHEQGCKNCRFWDEFDLDEDSGFAIGTCSRYPPQYAPENKLLFEANGSSPMIPHSVREWRQPTTDCCTYCGEWKEA